MQTYWPHISQLYIIVILTSEISANEPAKYFILVYMHSTAKTNDKTGRMVSNRISEVATSSVHSEKTSLKKLMMKMLIMKNRKK